MHIKLLAVLAVAATLLAACATQTPPPAQSASRSESRNEAYSEAVVDAPLAQVWNAFTTKDGVESWMVAHAEIDFRVGGMMRTHYRKEGVIGDEGTIENAVLSYDPQRMFSMRIAKTPKGFPFPKAWQSTWSVVYFEALGENKTKVSIRMLGYTEDEESQKMRAFFLRGNQYTLDQLVARFRSGK